MPEFPLCAIQNGQTISDGDFWRSLDLSHYAYHGQAAMPMYLSFQCHFSKPVEWTILVDQIKQLSGTSDQLTFTHAYNAQPGSTFTVEFDRDVSCIRRATFLASYISDPPLTMWERIDQMNLKKNITKPAYEWPKPQQKKEEPETKHVNVFFNWPDASEAIPVFFQPEKQQ